MTQRRKYRRVVFYKDYFEKFFIHQNEKVRAKIIWTLELIEEIERVPELYLKHISSTNGLYEIRVRQGRNMVRIFCFFHRDKLVILANAFSKKTDRTPKVQLESALRIKKEYEAEHKDYTDT